MNDCMNELWMCLDVSDSTCCSHRRSKGKGCNRSRGSVCKWVFVWSDKRDVTWRMLQSGSMQWWVCGTFSWGWTHIGESPLDVQTNANHEASHASYCQMNTNFFIFFFSFTFHFLSLKMAAIVLFQFWTAFCMQASLNKFHTNTTTLLLLHAQSKKWHTHGCFGFLDQVWIHIKVWIFMNRIWETKKCPQMDSISFINAWKVFSVPLWLIGWIKSEVVRSQSRLL